MKLKLQAKSRQGLISHNGKFHPTIVFRVEFCSLCLRLRCVWSETTDVFTSVGRAAILDVSPLSVIAEIGAN